MDTLIAPSILSADPLNLERDISLVANGGADLIHMDVMDGHYVPNLTFGPPLIKAVSKITNTPLDVHLMISNPEECIDAYIDAGASIITVHAEAVTHLHRLITYIQSKGVKAGVSINPATPTVMLKDVVKMLDLVLVMSVNPGFGGQSFIPHATQKIAEVAHMCKQTKSKALIEVDGGITPKTAPLVVEAGAHVLVAGSAVFGQPDPVQAMEEIRLAGMRVKQA